MRTQALLPLLLFVMSLNAQDASNSTYGNNLVTITPFSVYGSDDIDDVFLGLTYEHFTSDIMSLGGQVGIGLEDEGFQVGIGPKFYPSGHDKPISYGLSPTFLFTRAQTNDYFYDVCPACNSIGYSNENRVDQFGFMLVNSMNATLNEHIHFSLEGGLGINYVSEYEHDRNFEEGPSVTGMLRFNVGYRF